MKKKIFLIIICLVVVFLGAAAIAISRRVFAPQKTHYHAGFVVFEHNKKLDFSDNTYMYLEPCTLNEQKNDTQATIQIEKAHLHENVGDLVHIERTGAVWKDLFTNIRFPLDYANTTGFLNSKKVSDYQDQPIHPYDSLVVFIGRNDMSLLSHAVTKDYMMTMAKKSVTCGG